MASVYILRLSALAVLLALSASRSAAQEAVRTAASMMADVGFIFSNI